MIFSIENLVPSLWSSLGRNKLPPCRRKYITSIPHFYVLCLIYAFQYEWLKNNDKCYKKGNSLDFKCPQNYVKSLVVEDGTVGKYGMHYVELSGRKLHKWGHAS